MRIRVVKLLAFRAVVFTPMALMIFLLGNIMCYLLSLTGGVFSRDWPWHIAAREYYLYHGRSILQLEEDSVEFDEHLFYRARDGVSVFKNFEFTTSITNIDGHRANPYLGTASVEAVIIGDSFAQGWGVNDCDTVASVLTRDHGLNTVTYGVSSYGTARELLALKWALEKQASKPPKYLIIFYCVNDYPENLYYLRNGTKTYTEDQFRSLIGMAADNVAQQTLYRLPIKDHVDSLREGYRKWFVMAREGLDYGDSHGADLGVSYIEQASTFKAVLDSYADVIEDMSISVVSFKGWGGRDGFGEALASIPILANGIELNVIGNNLDHRAYYRLDGHLNTKGNEMMAEIIYDELRR